MQHNVARHKGQQFWMQKPKQPRIPPKVATKPEPAPAPVEPETSASPAGSAGAAVEPGTETPSSST